MIPPDYLEKFLQPFGIKAGESTFLRCAQNDVYLCHRGGTKCIVRISTGHHRSKAEIEAELLWISHLVRRGIHACAPLPAENGERCLSFEIDGEMYLVTCFEYAPGAEVSRDAAGEAFYQQLGALVNRMHGEEASFRAAHGRMARPEWRDSRLLRNDFAKMENSLMGKFRASVDDLILQLGRLPQSDKTYGLIHGDISFGNIFHHEDELWIIDFDNCEYGYFLQDLATVLWDTIYCRALQKFADAGLTDRMRPFWVAFLAGYAENGPPEAIDPLQLKRFFLLREAIVYVHYLRTLDLRTADDSFKAGLEVMRLNVENQEHQVDFASLSRFV